MHSLRSSPYGTEINFFTGQPLPSTTTTLTTGGSGSGSGTTGSAPNSGSFTNPDGTLTLQWEIVDDGTAPSAKVLVPSCSRICLMKCAEISFTLEVQTTGWVAVGFGDTPDMPNHDIAWGQVDDQSSQAVIVDRWSTAHEQPPRDTQQDLTVSLQLPPLICACSFSLAVSVVVPCLSLDDAARVRYAGRRQDSIGVPSQTRHRRLGGSHSVPVLVFVPVIVPASASAP